MQHGGIYGARKAIPSEMADRNCYFTPEPRVLAAYRGCSWLTRLRVWMRLRLCPYREILELLPETGSWVDVGCGDGLLVLLAGEGRRQISHGIDVDGWKVCNARQARSVLWLNVGFSHQDTWDLPRDSYDALSVVDVLYLLPLEKWDRFLGRAASVLRRGGVLILKEVERGPVWWKHWLVWLEEWLAIKVIGMTEGARPHFESLETIVSAVERAGFAVEHVREIRGRPHAHVLVMARK